MMRSCLALLLVAMLAAQGCGQTGDLYWPVEEQVEVDDEENREPKREN